MLRGEIMWKGIGNMKMVRGRKFGVWQPWKVERKYCGIGIGKMKMARGRKFGVCVSMAALEGGGGGGRKKGGEGGSTHGAWQALDRGRREREYTCSSNLV
jgi:hypothetical protein